MPKLAKTLTILTIISALILATGSFQAMAQDDTTIHNGDNYERMGVDLVLVRPLSFIATVLGTAVFIVSLPLSAAGGNAQQAFEKLVKEPAKHTFVRPLGEWDTEY